MYLVLITLREAKLAGQRDSKTPKSSLEHREKGENYPTFSLSNFYLNP